MGLLIK